MRLNNCDKEREIGINVYQLYMRTIVLCVNAKFVDIDSHKRD